MLRILDGIWIRIMISVNLCTSYCNSGETYKSYVQRACSLCPRMDLQDDSTRVIPPSYTCDINSDSPPFQFNIGTYKFFWATRFN